MFQVPIAESGRLATSPLVKMEVQRNVTGAVARQLPIVGSLLLLIAAFGAAPLLSATLEKGWLELLFSKGTPRYQIFLARVGAGVSLYAIAFIVATGPLALTLWWKSGVGTWPLLVTMLLESLGFLALLSPAALDSLPRKGS